MGAASLTECSPPLPLSPIPFVAPSPHSLMFLGPTLTPNPPPPPFPPHPWQLIKLRVLVVTVKGLGVETAKNLVLAGPAAVTVHDEGLVEAKDLGANFFLRESDIGRRRGEAVVAQLRALNEDVDLKTSRAFARAQGASSRLSPPPASPPPPLTSYPLSRSSLACARTHLYMSLSDYDAAPAPAVCPPPTPPPTPHTHCPAGPPMCCVPTSREGRPRQR
jgi:hypothetical protein